MPLIINPTAALTDLYWTGVRAADPGSALLKALKDRPRPAGKVWILAFGKAAHPMASAALAHLRKLGIVPKGGLVVGPQAGPDRPPLTTFVGDHPLPGPASFAAAQAIGELARWVMHDDEVWVLLSGGTSSLIAAPVHALSGQDLIDLFGLVLTSGLDIARMNTIRKRFSIWGGGNLARAVHGASVRVFIVSDVIGDDISTIGSGPCAPDEAGAQSVRGLLEGSGLWDRVPQSVRNHLAGVNTDKRSMFKNVEHRIVAGNRLMLEAVAERARALGLATTLHSDPLTQPAAETGQMIAARLRNQEPGTCEIWGGETVVRIDGPSGTGGRCQELALAASRDIADLPNRFILAAGSDGRDGPTDAAGGVVDGSSWAAIRKAGRDPERDLETHSSHDALQAAGALFRTGLTGTNVMDLVIGLRL